MECLGCVRRVYLQLGQLLTVKSQMSARQRSSTTTRSGAVWYLRSHIRQMTVAALTEETIGAIFVAVPFTYPAGKQEVLRPI